MICIFEHRSLGTKGNYWVQGCRAWSARLKPCHCFRSSSAIKRENAPLCDPLRSLIAPQTVLKTRSKTNTKTHHFATPSEAQRTSTIREMNHTQKRETYIELSLLRNARALSQICFFSFFLSLVEHFVGCSKVESIRGVGRNRVSHSLLVSP